MTCACSRMYDARLSTSWANGIRYTNPFNERKFFLNRSKINSQCISYPLLIQFLFLKKKRNFNHSNVFFIRLDCILFLTNHHSFGVISLQYYSDPGAIEKSEKSGRTHYLLNETLRKQIPKKQQGWRHSVIDV